MKLKKTRSWLNMNLPKEVGIHYLLHPCGCYPDHWLKREEDAEKPLDGDEADGDDVTCAAGPVEPQIGETYNPAERVGTVVEYRENLGHHIETLNKIWIFTTRQQSCGKVMFSVLSVCHYVHMRPTYDRSPYWDSRR